MRRGKKWIAVIMVTAMGMQLFSDGAFDTVSAAKRGAISQKKLTLKVGQKKKLKVKRVKGKIKWTSNKKKVAVVSAKGVVRARKKGKAVITAKVAGKKYKCKVTVKAKEGNSQPNQSTAPDSSSAAATMAPGQSEIPGGTVQPGGSALPAVTDNPGQSMGPNITSPNQSEEPVITNPNQSVEPGTTGNPNQSAKPDTTGDPNQSAGPGTTGNPNQSAEPNGTANPLQTAGADTSSAPQKTAEPEKERVTFSQMGGVYDEAFTLTLSNQSGHTIYYTMDGTDPRVSETRKTYQDGIVIRDRKGDANVLSAISPNKLATMNSWISGTEIISPFQAPSSANDVDKCCVVRAVSVDDEGNSGNVVTNTYFIGAISDHISGIKESVDAAGENLSVISIVMSPEDLFDEEKGIYVRGKYFNDSLKDYLSSHNNNLNGINVEHDLTANYKQKGREWERNCHIEYFETDGTNTTCKLEQDCGIRIQGNYSREHIQKSFRLYARAEYGVKNFKYSFFDDLTDAEGNEMDKFKSLVLRNGGNDVENYKYKDILTQSFIHDREVESHYGRPCVVYLDGEYWGYYVLQDDMSDNYLQQRRGVQKENVIAYKGTDDPQYSKYHYKLDEGDFPAGVTEENYYLEDTLNYLKNHNLADDTYYKKFVDQFVSEQSALDYFAINLFLNNGYDWPGKNWEIWRVTETDETNPYADGRWRFCLFDLDLTTAPTWVAGDCDAWCKDTISNLYDKNSSNVIQMIFSNMLDNASFRQKLDERIREVGSVDYEYNAVCKTAEKYRKSYSPLYEQFRKRFVISSYAVEANPVSNIQFYERRMGYIPTMLQNMHNRYSG